MGEEVQDKKCLFSVFEVVYVHVRYVAEGKVRTYDVESFSATDSDQA